MFAWRHESRAGLLALPAQGDVVVPPSPDFVPLLAEPVLPPAIEVEVAGAVVRVLPGMDAALLTSVLRAIRASAGAA